MNRLLEITLPALLRLLVTPSAPALRRGVLLAFLTSIAACTSLGSSPPPPNARPQSIIIAPDPPRQNDRRNPPMQGEDGSNKGYDQQAAQDLDAIFAREFALWKQQYAQRKRLATSCPTSTFYSYGMRLIQPASFRGDYSEIVRQRYGTGSEFLVVAVAPNSAATAAQFQAGDRILRIHTIDANQADSSRRVATESRTWRQAYDIVFERDGKLTTRRLRPDVLCDLKL